MEPSTDSVEGEPEHTDVLQLLLEGKEIIAYFLTLCLQVLLSICSLLTDPNPDDPLVPEIAHM